MKEQSWVANAVGRKPENPLLLGSVVSGDEPYTILADGVRLVYFVIDYLVVPVKEPCSVIVEVTCPTGVVPVIRTTAL